MAKVIVEFINTCSCCDEHGNTIKNIAAKYGEAIEVKIYYAGRDFDYVKKYGMITKGTMIVNGKKKYETLSKDIVEKVIGDAVTAYESVL